MANPAEGAAPESAPPATPQGRAVNRRRLLAGLGAAGVGAAGVAAVGLGRPAPPAAPAAGGATPTGSPFASPAATPVPATPLATPAASPAAARFRRAAAPVPDGMALVTSPRLPLFGVGPDDPARLLAGRVDDWREVGSPVRQPVEPLALAGAAEPLARPVATLDGYEALVEALASRPGGVALVPVEEVDFRVNVLSVAGLDPLRDDPPTDAPTLRLAVIGDIVPGRNVHAKMVAYGDFARPFRAIAPHLAGFDLTIANLEGNLSSTLPQPPDPHSFSFVSDPAMIEGLRLAGIDAVGLANNHTVWNAPAEAWGLQGFLDTVAALDAEGFPYFGGGQTLEQARAPFSATVAGTTVAVLGIDGVTANAEVEPGVGNGVLDFDASATTDRPGTNPYLTAQFLEDIAAAAERFDVVVPYFHMGAEYVAVPPPWAVAGARAAIDAGASAVVTNHPHVIQGMEIYQGRPIVYSPGNFVFDQMFAVEVRSGYVLDLTFRGGRVVGLRAHGVEIEDFHQPRPMTAGEQANLMDRFWTATDRLAAWGD